MLASSELFAMFSDFQEENIIGINILEKYPQLYKSFGNSKAFIRLN